MSLEFDPPTAAVGFGQSLNNTYAYTSAAIRAFERAQGARLRANTNELAKRLAEAQKYALAGSAALEQLARHWPDLAAVMSDLPDADVLRSRMPPAKPRDLPNSISHSFTSPAFREGGSRRRSMPRAAGRSAEDSSRLGTSCVALPSRPWNSRHSSARGSQLPRGGGSEHTPGWFKAAARDVIAATYYERGGRRTRGGDADTTCAPGS
ncbi:MAG: hypothetical protein ACR2ND_06160 [Solirubrobacteraceae bacterium]